MINPSASIVAFVAAALGAATPEAQTQFRSRVDVVELNVSVLAGKKAVVDLTATDFIVTDNGVRQTVTGVAREAVPIDLTIAIDTSENMARSMAPPIEKAVNRVSGRLRPADRVSVVTFDSHAHELASLAPPPVGPVDARPTGGPSALHDALAGVLTPKPVIDRRQMAIVFTDGFNSMGGLTEADVLDLAARSNVTVFVVTRVWQPSLSVLMTGPVSSPGKQALAFFERLAGVTGGLTQFVSPGAKWVAPNGSSAGVSVNQNILDDAFMQALDDFRSSYVLRYSPPAAPDTGWHEVAVSVTRPGKTYSVRTRRGYLAK